MIYLLFIRLIMVRTGGLQVVLIELYSVLCMCVQHVGGHHKDWATDYKEWSQLNVGNRASSVIFTTGSFERGVR